MCLTVAGCGSNGGCSDCGGSGGTAGTGGGTAGTGGGATGTVTDLEVESAILEGLEHPWDVAWLPDGTLLVTERPGGINVYFDGLDEPPLTIAPTDRIAEGEGGMLGLEVDPDFASNGYIYACFCSTRDGGPDVRVVRFTLSSTDAGQPLARRDIVTGMPYSTGRHSGCRPRFGPDGYLWVGTGDAAIASTPQDPDSLGGKVLRVDRDGAPAPGNPDGGMWLSNGHRNIQGIAFRRSDGLGMSAEHGPQIDDELNLLIAGNFGWDPGPNYDEDVPMTDTEKFPDAIEAAFSTGSPTLAYSGAEFIEGDRWADWNGALAVATLKAQHLHIYFVDSEGAVTDQGEYITEQGRLRSPRMGPDGLLYVTTDGSGQSGRVLRVAPVVTQDAR